MKYNESKYLKQSRNSKDRTVQQKIKALMCFNMYMFTKLY